MSIRRFILSAFLFSCFVWGQGSIPDPAPLPSIEDLPFQTEMPDPLKFLDGSLVKTRDQWFSKRRPELLTLFQHYMYGYMPNDPFDGEYIVKSVDEDFLNGTAVKKQIELKVGINHGFTLPITLVVPKNPAIKRAPCFLGLNLNDPQVVARAIERKYAIATVSTNSLAKDSADFEKAGIVPHYFRPGESHRRPYDWGVMGAWVWGLMRAAEFLSTEDSINPSKIIAVGHSRKGRAALIAGVMSEHISIIMPHQSGVAGAAPLRVREEPKDKIGSVDGLMQRYPFWFNEIFLGFSGDNVDRFPFDQDSLIALAAPKPILLGCALTGDLDANPVGMFRAAQSASRVYKFLGVEGLTAQALPTKPGTLISSRLGIYARPVGGHAMIAIDFGYFADYADKY